MVTVRAFSGGGKPFYLWNQGGGRNIQKKLKTKEKERWSSYGQCRAANRY